MAQILVSNNSVRFKICRRAAALILLIDQGDWQAGTADRYNPILFYFILFYLLANLY
jgi:hypothetical protein